jgi:predicted Zn finger-like uncharacterized protein
MYTYCPSCSTVFAIKAEHLLAAGGRVRCGECGLVFRAFDYVYDDLDMAQSALADHLARQSEQTGQVEQTAQFGEDERASAGLDEAAAGNPDGLGIIDGPIAAGFPMPPQYSTAWSMRYDLWRTLGKGAIICALLLLLGVQWVYFNRAALAAQNDWRPGLQTLCAVLRCELPLQVDLSRIELLNRDVRKHPQVAGALLINATLVNRATFPQPFPILELTFSNASGTPVASRRFSPAEYLGDRTDLKPGMPVDVPLQVVLEIEDPGEDAVSFQFEFL